MKGQGNTKSTRDGSTTAKLKNSKATLQYYCQDCKAVLGKDDTCIRCAWKNREV